MSIAKWEIASLGLLAGIAFIVGISGLKEGSLQDDLGAINLHFSDFIVKASDNFIGSLGVLVGIDKKPSINASQNQTVVFPAVTLEGKAALVMDALTGDILYASNADTVMPLASLTKLATALVADNIIPDSRPITISSRALAEEGDNLLKRDDTWTKKDISDFSLIISSNDGARALAETAEYILATNRASLAASAANPTQGQTLVGTAIAATPESLATDKDAASSAIPETFVDAMNRYMVAIGIPGLTFNNPTGLDVASSTAGGYGTAKDIAKLLQHILLTKPELVTNTAQQTAAFIPKSGAIYNPQNTDTAIPDMSGLIASKTGFTDLAQGNLIIAFDADIGRPMIAVVLGSSVEGRFTDILSLIHATKTYLSDTISL